VEEYERGSELSPSFGLLGADTLGQQAGIWFGLSALTQIAFGDFRYPQHVIGNGG